MSEMVALGKREGNIGSDSFLGGWAETQYAGYAVADYQIEDKEEKDTYVVNTMSQGTWEESSVRDIVSMKHTATYPSPYFSPSKNTGYLSPSITL